VQGGQVERLDPVVARQPGVLGAIRLHQLGKVDEVRRVEVHGIERGHGVCDVAGRELGAA